MKWFRDSAETSGRDWATFSNSQYTRVPQILHEKGPHYTFVHDVPANPWRWQDMVAQMDEFSRRLLCKGLDDRSRSRGVVSCRLQKTDMYDHKRHHADPERQDEMLFVWDFVLTLEDRTQIFLHPAYNGLKIQAFAHEPRRDHELPRNGKGGTKAPSSISRTRLTTRL